MTAPNLTTPSPVPTGIAGARRPRLTRDVRRHRTTVSTPMATVLYPGSFDPIHLGHLDVVEQAVELFGHVTVAVMHNREKTGGMFKVEQRMELVRDAAGEAGIGEHVAVTAHAGLALDVAREVGAAFIVK